MLAYGLKFPPSSKDPVIDTDAGDRLALNVEIYWPFLLLTAGMVVVWLASTIWPNRGAAGLVAGAAALGVLFNLHALTHDYLNGLLPDLRLYGRVSLGTTLPVALLSFLLAALPESVTGDAGSDLVAEKP